MLNETERAELSSLEGLGALRDGKADGAVRVVTPSQLRDAFLDGVTTDDNSRLTIEQQEQLNNWFVYHAPVGNQIAQYAAINEASRQLARVIMLNSPKSADQSVALRKVREAKMSANAAIACGGK